MAELTKLALAYIEEWQQLDEGDRSVVLALLNDKRHEFEKLNSPQRNAFATAAYLLAELTREVKQ